ncbi:MAG: hypothetical protein M1816_005751 [Peltula sp. TS41687]|nr:MAG: hypothetical protein M1816_005751 [Peltula sp. TS41687]
MSSNSNNDLHTFACGHSASKSSGRRSKPRQIPRGTLFPLLTCRSCRLRELYTRVQRVSRQSGHLERERWDKVVVALRLRQEAEANGLWKIADAIDECSADSSMDPLAIHEELLKEIRGLWTVWLSKWGNLTQEEREQWTQWQLAELEARD